MRFRSSAAIPRLYRIKFKRDIFKDLTKLEKSYKGKTDEGEEMQIEDLEIFENVADIMAWHADPTIPGTIEEWLDEFEMFSIYQVLPEILELWGANLVTDIESEKRNPSAREITTPLFLLRCLEIGLSMSDLNLLTIGMVLDIWTEKATTSINTAKRKPCGQPDRKTSTISEYTGQNTSNHTIKRFLPSNG